MEWKHKLFASIADEPIVHLLSLPLSNSRLPFSRSALTHTHTLFLSTVLIVVRGSMFTVWCVKCEYIFSSTLAEQQPKLGYLFRFCVHFLYTIWFLFDRLFNVCRLKLIFKLQMREMCVIMCHTHSIIASPRIVKQTENMSKLKIAPQNRIQLRETCYFFESQNCCFIIIIQFVPHLLLLRQIPTVYKKCKRTKKYLVWNYFWVLCCGRLRTRILRFDPTNVWLKTPKFIEFPF